MKIHISRLAAYKTKKLLDYLIEEWSVGAKNRFLVKMNSQFERLKKNPRSCAKSDIIPELRRFGHYQTNLRSVHNKKRCDFYRYSF